MSWFRQSAAVLCLCALLSACGFTPLHHMADARGDITVAIIPDRDGQYLRNLLIDRFGDAQNARYLLQVAPLKTELTNLGIEKDATITHIQTGIETTVTLTDRASNAVVLTRDLRALGGYDVLDAQYATLVTKRDVTERVLEELAQSISTAVLLHLAENP